PERVPSDSGGLAQNPAGVGSPPARVNRAASRLGETPLTGSESRKRTEPSAKSTLHPAGGKLYTCPEPSTPRGAPAGPGAGYCPLVSSPWAALITHGPLGIVPALSAKPMIQMSLPGRGQPPPLTWSTK